MAGNVAIKTCWSVVIGLPYTVLTAFEIVAVAQHRKVEVAGMSTKALAGVRRGHRGVCCASEALKQNEVHLEQLISCRGAHRMAGMQTKVYAAAQENILTSRFSPNS